MALPDMPGRLKRLLPPSWFGTGAAPVRDAVLAAFGAPLSWAYSLYTFVLAQSRLSTASGIFVDLFALDFFGRALPRRTGETDDSYIPRIAAELVRPRNTRAAVSQALQDLTGHAPVLIEPWNPGDCSALGYSFGVGVGAPLGSLSLTDQVFIQINPPQARFWLDAIPGLPLFGFSSGVASATVSSGLWRELFPGLPLFGYAFGFRPVATSVTVSSGGWLDMFPGLPLFGYVSGFGSVAPPTAISSGLWFEMFPGLPLFGYGVVAPRSTGVAQGNAGIAGVGTAAGGVGAGAFTPISQSGAGSLTTAEIYATVLRNVAAGVRAWVRIN